MRCGSGLILREAALQRLPADEAMRQRDAEIAQHRRVGQVALPARDRQLVGEEAQQGIGQSEIALGIFEVDRIDLVRHGRGADFAGDARCRR